MANIRKYDPVDAIGIATAVAVTKGRLYGISSGALIAATNVAGGIIQAIGCAINDVTANEGAAGKQAGLVNRAVVDLDAAMVAGGALTVGAPVYLATGGGYTSTQPSANGTGVQPVGFAIAALQIWLDVRPSALKAQTSGNSTAALV